MESVAAAPRRPAGRVGPKPWGPVDAIIAIGVALVVLFAIASVAYIVTEAVTGQSNQESSQQVAAGVVATIIFDVFLVGIAYFFSVRRYHLSWRALGLRPLESELWWVPPVAALGLMVANASYSLLMQALGFDALAPEQELNDLFDARVLLPVTGVFTVLVAPVAEEIFVRGFLFATFIGRLGVWGAALLSGLLWGSVHITSVDTIGIVIPIGGIGVVLALVYYRTGSLWATIIAHLIINSIAFAFLASGAT